MQQGHHAAATTDRKNGSYMIKNKIALVRGVSPGIMLSRLRRFVPPRLFERVFRKQFQLDEPSK